MIVDAPKTSGNLSTMPGGILDNGLARFHVSRDDRAGAGERALTDGDASENQRT
jgi:hypothetical protein